MYSRPSLVEVERQDQVTAAVSRRPIDVCIRPISAVVDYSTTVLAWSFVSIDHSDVTGDVSGVQGLDWTGHVTSRQQRAVLDASSSMNVTHTRSGREVVGSALYSGSSLVFPPHFVNEQSFVRKHVVESTLAWFYVH